MFTDRNVVPNQIPNHAVSDVLPGSAETLLTILSPDRVCDQDESSVEKPSQI